MTFSFVKIKTYARLKLLFKEKDKVMRDQEDQPKDEKKIEDSDQFQMHRAGGNAGEGHLPKEEKDDSEYTEEEIPFADGAGTKLDEWIVDEDDEETEE